MGSLHRLNRGIADVSLGKGSIAFNKLLDQIDLKAGG